MPTGLGSRKVLTPKSSKAPRRSLPPQAKLIEAASFESIEDVPSSPDIMTQKLQEKVKERKQQQHSSNYNKPSNSSNTTTTYNSNSNSSFNQRLAAAASNSLSANAGRSKLSTEEFKLSDDNEESLNLNDKYKRNEVTRSAGMNNHNSTNITNSTKSNSYRTGGPYSGHANANSNTSHVSNSNNTSGYNATASVAANKPSSSSNYNSSASRTYGYSGNSNYNNINTPSISNNSFDRWNTSIINSSNAMESVELLKDQLSHQQRDYDSLKQRFNELSRMRFTEPEEQLEEHKRLSDLRDQDAQKAIKSLQKEKEQVLDQLKALKLELNESKTSSRCHEQSEPVTEQNDSNEDFMNEVEKILKIYSSFSGLKITPTPTNPLHQWHCEFSSRSGRFEFQLTYESALNRYQYVPLSSGSIKDLPPFLASDILITTDQMQLFFWRLLDTLSKRKD